MSPRLERHAERMRAGSPVLVKVSADTQIEITDPLARQVMENEILRQRFNQRDGKRRALQARRRIAGKTSQLDTSKAGRRKPGKRLAQGNRE